MTVRAEWTKLRTTPGTLGLLLAVIGTTVGVRALVANAVARPTGGACALDPVRVSLTGVQLGQSVVAIVAVLGIAGEYSTGMVQTTFTAMPRRFAVLVAKAAVVAAAVAANVQATTGLDALAIGPWASWPSGPPAPSSPAAPSWPAATPDPTVRLLTSAEWMCATYCSRRSVVCPRRSGTPSTG